MTRYDQLMDMIAVDTDDCIVWPYTKTPNGYGMIRFGGRTVGTHRAALASVSPPPTPQHQAAHGECHNRACANPKHLSWKTKRENEADKYRDGTDNNGEENGQCKVTTEQVAEIRSRYKGRGNGPTMRELAAEYGISVTNIHRILHYQRRKLR